MHAAISWAVSMLAGFLLGSLPFGLWWGRIVKGIDVRQHGSRNLGATNVYRVLGPAHGITVLALDVAKGAAAVVLARSLAHSELAALLAGLMAVLGHLFSPWVAFRGGKGVATGLGIWLVLSPIATVAALGVWGLVIVLTRRVSAASLAATTALVPLVFWTGLDDARIPRVVLAALIAALVWVRHRGNVARLARGEEPPLWGNKPQPIVRGES